VVDISGINHIAFLTSDLDRLTGFYEELFGARKVVELPIPEPEGPGRHALIAVGAGATLHVFEFAKIRPRLSGRCSSAVASITSP